MKNFGDFTYFVYIGNNKSYGFMTYRDGRTGLTKGFIIGKDAKGNPIYKKWRFNNDSMRQIRVHKDEVDLEGQNAIEFLRNSPECMGSENGSFVNGEQVLVYFKELNQAKDAELALESRELSWKAQGAALALKGEELFDFAALIGVFTKDAAIARHRVVDYASNFPKKMLEYVDDPARKVKALIKKAINSSVFQVDGKQIKWEGKLIGADEDEAVTNVLKDEKLKKAVELNLAKFGG